jgi:phage terminase small subunit
VRPDRGLTAQQQIFAVEYSKTFNATDAAKEAGYAQPDKRGAELKDHPAICALVEEICEARIEASLIDSNKIAKALWDSFRLCQIEALTLSRSNT